MQQVFYIHGGNAYSNYDDFISHLKNCELRYPHGDKLVLWGGNLRKTLGDKIELFTPEMPNSKNAKYEEWKIWFERHFEYLNENVVLVGWSLGGYFLIKYLIEESFPVDIKALLLIASPAGEDDFDGEDGGDFNFDTTEVGRLAERADQIHIFHSKDDFVVPYEHALKLKGSLPAATLHTFEDRNHFLQEEFPELVEIIRELAAE